MINKGTKMYQNSRPNTYKKQWFDTIDQAFFIDIKGYFSLSASVFNESLVSKSDNEVVTSFQRFKFT